jgi:hypothetical protein
MSGEEEGASSEEAPGTAGDASAGMSEEELRAAYEAELSRITSADVMLQATVSLLNIGGRRLGLGASEGADAEGAAGAERDLEQVRDAIDGARALIAVLERRYAREVRPLRDALSQLQIAYAREVGTAGGDAAAAEAQGEGRGEGAPAGEAPAGQGGQAQEDRKEQRGPGPAESSGRLWVPGR